MASNRPEFVVAFHGSSKIGAASVLLSPAWKRVEALQQPAAQPVANGMHGPVRSKAWPELLGEVRVADLDTWVKA